MRLDLQMHAMNCMESGGSHSLVEMVMKIGPFQIHSQRMIKALWLLQQLSRGPKDMYKTVF